MAKFTETQAKWIATIGTIILALREVYSVAPISGTIVLDLKCSLEDYKAIIAHLQDRCDAYEHYITVTKSPESELTLNIITNEVYY